MVYQKNGENIVDREKNKYRSSKNSEHAEMSPKITRKDKCRFLFRTKWKGRGRQGQTFTNNLNSWKNGETMSTDTNNIGAKREEYHDRQRLEQVRLVKMNNPTQSPDWVGL